ncbi:MAG: L-aspartate oxidase [Saprospiraceae bacterium]|nr:L-aspartate oxidase [Saprospiraceae bacterium]
MEKRSDVLIIGSGVAGLSTAINLAEKRPDLSIHVLAKVDKSETNTRYAQGGIATVWDFDSDNFVKHIEDTEDAGDGLCDKEVVEMVVREGHERVQELIKWGAQFDKDQEGDYELGMEGGHSENRILHFKDLTGSEVQRALLQRSEVFPNIKIFENYYAIDLITQHHLGWNVTRMTPDIECYGAYVLDTDELDVEKHVSRITILATGGAGQIYMTTTNPSIATGDGMAMAYRAKCRLSNMEFVQFHPTALWTPIGENPAFLISEAVRGFGGILKSSDGEPFMHKYDDRKSLAPRDIVARAIDNEMKIRGDDFVTLDCTHLDMQEFKAHFPTIHHKCLSIGIDPSTDLIPVVPACHYYCGGIDVDINGKSSINHLYASGECTHTGLHGANRLASNSLLEGLVFGHRIADDISQVIDSIGHNKDVPAWDAQGTKHPKEMVLITQSWKELKAIMSSYVGIVRSNVRLKRAMDRLWLLYKETEDLYHSSILSPQLCELRNLITIGYLVTRSAQMRKESRGLHFTTDYPEKKDFLEQTYL